MLNRISRRLKIIFTGKYDLDEIFRNHKIHGETLVDSRDILYYSEVTITIGIFLTLTSVILGLMIHPSFLVFLIFSALIFYFSINLDFVFLTDERLLIERRTIIDRLLSTSSITNIALDQISIIETGRARPNFPLLFGSSFFFMIGLITLFLLESPLIQFFVAYFSFVLFLLAIFALRLYRRSVTLFVVGTQSPIEIAHRKGISLNWVQKLHDTLFERIHHVTHVYKSPNDLYTKSSEFPLEMDPEFKNTIDSLSHSVEKEIIRVLYFQPCTKRQLYRQLPSFEHHLIDYALAHLSKENLIHYDRSKRVWTITGKTLES